MSNYLVRKRHSILRRRYSIIGFEVDSKIDKQLDAILLERRGVPYLVLVGNTSTLDSAFTIANALSLDIEVQNSNGIDVIFSFIGKMFKAGVNVSFNNKIDATLLNGLPIKFDAGLYPVKTKIFVKSSMYNEIYMHIIDDINTNIMVDISKAPDVIGIVVEMYSVLYLDVKINNDLRTFFSVFDDISLYFSLEMTLTESKVFIVNSLINSYFLIEMHAPSGIPHMIFMQNKTNFSIIANAVRTWYINEHINILTDIYSNLVTTNARIAKIFNDTKTEFIMSAISSPGYPFITKNIIVSDGYFDLKIGSGKTLNTELSIKNFLSVLYFMAESNALRQYVNISNFINVLFDQPPLIDIDLKINIETRADVTMYRITWTRLEHLDSLQLSFMDYDILEDLYRTEEQ